MRWNGSVVFNRVIVGKPAVDVAILVAPARKADAASKVGVVALRAR